MIIPNKPVLDIFCGPGGFGTGFEKYYEIPLAIDIEKNAVHTYQANHPDTQTRQQDIRNLSTASRDFEGIIGIIGGSPCQQWSCRNTRRIENDPRCHLPEEYLRIVEEIKPEFFVFENVTTAPEEIQSEFIRKGKNLGYTIASHYINAVNYGAAQTRKRWVVVGTRHGTWVPGRMKTVQQPKTVRMAFSSLNTNWGYMKSRPDTLEKLARATTAWTSISDDSDYGSIIRLLLDQPAPTVCNVKKIYMVHPTENRNITSAEAAALQGFPNNYIWHGDQHSIGQQIADAVPVEFSSCIAESIAGMIA